jgi:hypothetical protein
MLVVVVVHEQAGGLDSDSVSASTWIGSRASTVTGHFAH